MKQTLIAMMLASGLSATAADYPFLTFQKTDGSLQSVAVESLVLTYVDGTLTVTNANGKETLMLSELSKMYFSQTNESTTTGVTSVDAVEGPVEVYTLAGVNAGSFASVSAARHQLRSGVYVIVADGRNYKLHIK